MEKKIYKQPEIKTVELKEKLLDDFSTVGEGDPNQDAGAKEGSYDFGSEE